MIFSLSSFMFYLSSSFAIGYELKFGSLFQAVSVLLSYMSLKFVSLFDLTGEFKYFEMESSVDSSASKISSG